MACLREPEGCGPVDLAEKPTTNVVSRRPSLGDSKSLIKRNSIAVLVSLIATRLLRSQPRSGTSRSIRRSRARLGAIKPHGETAFARAGARFGSGRTRSRAHIGDPRAVFARQPAPSTSPQL